MNVLVHLNAKLWFGLMYQTGTDSGVFSGPVDLSGPDCGPIEIEGGAY